MSIFSQNDYDLFINAVAYNIWIDEANMKSYLNIGIDPYSWPPSAIKTLLIDFMCFSEAKGHQAAAQQLHQKFMNLEKTDIDYPPYKIKAMIDNYVGVYNAKQLGAALLNVASPVEASKLIDEHIYKLKPSGIELLDLNETLASTFLGHLKDLEAGKAIMKINNFPLLSKAIMGFNKDLLTVISASTGVGKTKFALNLALEASKDRFCCFYNMELSPSSFARQIIQRECKISSNDYMEGKCRDETSLKKIDQLISTSNSNFKFTGGSALTSNQICASIHDLACKNENALFVIDYDQKVITPGHEQEYQELKTFAGQLDSLAIDVHCHIILIAQSKKVEATSKEFTGMPRASERSIQSCTNLLNLYKDPTSGRYFIIGIKTRGSMEFILELIPELHISNFKEKGFVKNINETLTIKPSIFDI